jgi:Na+(H+)/acetate symporter ActP
MNSQLRTADLIVLIVYMAGVFALGCWFARKSNSTKEFMAAGGALPGWAVGLSIFGTYVSSIGFLGAAGNAYSSIWPDTWSTWKNPLHKNMTIIVGTCSIVLIGILLGSLAAGPRVTDKTTDRN